MTRVDRPACDAASDFAGGAEDEDFLAVISHEISFEYFSNGTVSAQRDPAPPNLFGGEQDFALRRKRANRARFERA
jgi:hypothetical protein